MLIPLRLKGEPTINSHIRIFDKMGDPLQKAERLSPTQLRDETLSKKPVPVNNTIIPTPRPGYNHSPLSDTPFLANLYPHSKRNKVRMTNKFG